MGTKWNHKLLRYENYAGILFVLLYILFFFLVVMKRNNNIIYTIHMKTVHIISTKYIYIHIYYCKYKSTCVKWRLKNQIWNIKWKECTVRVRKRDTPLEVNELPHIHMYVQYILCWKQIYIKLIIIMVFFYLWSNYNLKLRKYIFYILTIRFL